MYFILLILTILYQIPISSDYQKDLIIILFIILTLVGIFWPLFIFSTRLLIIRDDVISPPKVPIKYITKKKNYTVDYKDILWFKVTKYKGKVDGVLIYHPDFRRIDINIYKFHKKAVIATIKQLKKNIGQKERK